MTAESTHQKYLSIYEYECLQHIPKIYFLGRFMKLFIWDINKLTENFWNETKNNKYYNKYAQAGTLLIP